MMRLGWRILARGWCTHASAMKLLKRCMCNRCDSIMRCGALNCSQCLRHKVGKGDVGHADSLHASGCSGFEAQ